MPMAPPRACRCGALLTDDRPCPRCRRVQDRARGNATQRGYTHAWAGYSRKRLLRFPWCGQRDDGQLYAEHSRCVQQGLKTKATVTDHRIPIRDGGSVFDPDNHQSLCTSCNAAKAVEDR